MKIVHIAPKAPYNDNWGYQENLLPKYQEKLENDVALITTNRMHESGKIVETSCGEYFLENGVRVVRMAVKKFALPSITDLFSYMPVYHKLVELKPDFIFFHGLHGITIFDVIRYKKYINPTCVIVEDNHLDYNIRNDPEGIKGWFCRSFQRWVNRKSIPYVSRVYGVTPWRKTYAEDYYQIPSNKTDVLIMGADDEKIDFSARGTIRKQIREKYGIMDTDFLIVTGGKIDKKKKTDVLMKAVSNFDKVKLLVFGQVNNDIKDEFDQIQKFNSNIIYIGWIDADKVYDYFFAADLVFFPGQHSVLWEQACASKVPCVFEKWDGMDHVNNGGNSDFVTPVTVETISKEIKELLFTDKYQQMKEIAESEKTDIYLYSRIAKKSLECAKMES